MKRLITVAVIATALASPLRAEQVVPQDQAQISLSFAPVVRETAPAVVNIYVSRVVQEQVSPFAGDPVFEQFFQGFGATQPRVQNSLGSGVIVSADGVVITNYHVAGQATDIRVVLNDRREYAATVMLADEGADIAVLRLQGATGLPHLTLRDSDELQVGDLVLAIGNPFGVGQTVSSGIVSALARSAQVGNGRGYFIQTDAAINPGNSGGALVDMQGQLVGINTAILTQNGGSNGIGFAIPSNLVRSFVDQATAGAQEFARPWAGLTGQAMDAAVAESMGLSQPDGVLISEMHPASPFAAAGLQVGDVILSLDGHPTNTAQEVMFRLAATGIGATAQVVWLRDGAEMTGTVDLIAAPDDPPARPVTITDDVALRGLSVAQINPKVIADQNLPLMATGVIVTDVADLAARAGFLPGDVVLAVNNGAIGSVADLQAAAAQASRFWAIDLLRQGRVIQLRFRL